MDLVLEVKIKGDNEMFKVIAGKSSNSFTDRITFKEYRKYKGRSVRQILKCFKYDCYRQEILKKVYSIKDIEYIQMYFL